MMKRIAVACAALFMWAAFGALVWTAWLAFPVLAIAWVARDSNWLRSRLTCYGQALDSCANVVLLDGHPKETISSHVGRMYSAKYGNPDKGMAITDADYVLPWQAIAVYHITNLGEARHVYKAVEDWAVKAEVPL